MRVLLLATLCIISVNAFSKEIIKDALNKDIHKQFTPKELHQIFGSEDVSHVPEYQIVHPYTVDEKAERSSKVRRSLHHTEPMYLQFDAFGKNFHLAVTENKDLVPKNQLIEHHSYDGIKRYKGNPGKFSTGKIVSDESSNVALDHTSGLRGMLLKDDQVYIIAPVPERLLKVKRTTDAHGAHIVYKRSSLAKSHPASDFVCGTTGKFNPMEKMLRTRRKRRSTSSNPEKIMELMIVGDKNAVLYHGKEFLYTYLLSIGNIVAGVYKDPTLEYPITVAITRVVLLDNDALANASNTGELLNKFRSWFVLNNPANESDPLHVDNGALLTKGGCLDGCGVAGLAGEGMCQFSQTQSVSKDKGLMSALTMAHEIGHNLNLYHDSGECLDGVNIMASSTVASGTGFEWSKCSSTALAANLRSGSSWCYDDKPVASVLTNVTFQHYGRVFDGTKQCELAFGKGYTHCYQYQHVCSRLYCLRPTGGFCDHTAYPAAQGTYCKNHHWCIYGECVRDGTPLPTPIDGGWSAYGDYIKCNRECGGGVQWQERTCTNPAPQNGGKKCEGPTRAFWKTCNFRKTCPAGTKTFRQVQCEKFATGYTPVIDPKKPCLLLCASGGAPLYVGVVEDGTFPYSTKGHVCIQGIIKSIGCDLELESGAIHDRCGVCGGDGSTCAPVTFENLNPYGWAGVHELGSIPAGTLNLKVVEKGPSYNFISVKVGGSNDLAYYVPSWSKDVAFAGVTCKYSMLDYYFADTLICSGISTDIVRPVWANYYGGSSPGIKWTYYTSTEGNTSKVEYKATSGWGACSKTCAGGTQTRSIACQRVDDKSPISLVHCQSLPKLSSTQACNTNACPPQWYIHPWGKCSKSCGKGQKFRNITCSELRHDGKYYEVSDVSLCTAAKPNVTVVEDCNAVMCIAEWVLGAWGPCSTTCGQGIMVQQISCKRTNADGSVVTARDLECTSPKPSTVEACNIDSPCPQWKIEYTTCSKTCGGGEKNPYVACYIVDKLTNNSACNAAEKPDISSLGTKTCNTEACDSFEWNTIDGTCNVSCGDGIIPVNVTCKSVLTGTVVSDSFCTDAVKPPTTKPCNAGDCPEIYEWKIVEGVCSVTCGTGTSTNQVVCIRKRDGFKADDVLCEASTKPSTGSPKECTMQSCPETYSWNTTYSGCSVSCGIGTKQPIVKCIRDSDKEIVADSNCSSEKPSPPALSCDMGECPPSYYWKELWGQCSAVCGQGTQGSYFKCSMASTNTIMSDSYCEGQVKPASRTRECASVCSWVPTYGLCLPKCGNGYKMVTLACQNEMQVEADPSMCKGSSIPGVVPKKCSAEPCKKYAPSNMNIPTFYDVGCYKDDLKNRRVPHMVENLRNQINWKNMSETVILCSRKATAYKYFAIQYYGECWGGNDETYFLSGSSQQCWMGTGKEFNNYVYSYNGPESTTSLPSVKPIGCFKDHSPSERPLPVMIDNFRSVLVNNPLTKDTAALIVSKCAKIASKRGFNTFGIQYYGECWSGPTANMTYSKDGISSDCQHKVGLQNSNYVYQFT